MNPEYKPIRMAMVGGGPGAFIGPVHRMAAELDRKVQLVAGAFSRDMDKSKAAAAAWGVSEDRAYDDFRKLILAESARDDGAELIVVVTPNATHFEIAKLALEAGMHVISDKPATATLQEALELEAIVRKAKGLYALTFTYTGYPLIRRARSLIAEGAIGAVRKVAVEYSQGWMWQAADLGWRTSPSLSGEGGCIGDIGVHAFNLAEYVSGQTVDSLCADISSIVPGRQLDDDCNVLLRFGNGAPGILHASQVATGDRNGLILRVWGEAGGLEWRHEANEQLIINRPNGPTEIWHAGEGYANTGTPRLPTGHPQGFIEAFANIYGDVADAIRGQHDLQHVPGIREGVRSMAFINKAIASSQARSWLPLTNEVVYGDV